MRKWTKRIMATSLVIIGVSALSSCSLYTSGSVYKPILEKDRKEHKTFTFYDFTHSSAEIKLKLQDVHYYEYIEAADVKMSYIIDVLDPLPGTDSYDVYLGLLDENGFEISRFRVGRVVPKYVGSLKGNIVISPQVYKKLADAEIKLYK